MKNPASKMVGKVLLSVAVFAVLSVWVSVTRVRQNDRIAQENARRAGAMNRNLSHLMPDVATRSGVESLSVTDIESLQLYGMNMGSFNGGSTPPIVVTDTALIASFLQSLQSATSPAIRIGNGVDTLELHLKRKQGKAKRPLSFPFNPQFPALWYGTQFNGALDQLAAFQAQQVRQKVNGLAASQVRSASLGKTIITDPDQLAALLKALHNVGPQAYAYTTRTGKQRAANFETVHLVLRTGKTVDLRFFLSPRAPNTVLKPLWDFYDSAS